MFYKFSWIRFFIGLVVIAIMIGPVFFRENISWIELLYSCFLTACTVFICSDRSSEMKYLEDSLKLQEKKHEEEIEYLKSVIEQHNK